MFIAADESGIAGGYLVIGTVWMPNELVPEFERSVSDFRLKNHFWREFHFENLGKSGVDEFTFKNHLEFLKLCIAVGVEFKCIVVDLSLIDLKKFHDDNDRIMQLNFLCVLIRNKFRADFPETIEELTILSDSFIGPQTEITRIERSFKNEKGVFSIEETEIRRSAIQHAKLRTESEIERKVDCFAQCSSHLSSAIQLADLFAGAVAARIAGIEESDHRMELVRLLEDTFGQKLNQRSLPSKRDLNVWIWRPPRS